MNIIFDDVTKLIPNSFTVLELDTFKDSATCRKSTAWCIVEKIPLVEFATLDEYRTTHSNLMQQYRSQNWEYCRSALSALAGRWSGELDSFYEILSQRINELEFQPLPADWDGSLVF